MLTLLAWILSFSAGTAIVILFVYILWDKKHELTAPLLGLLTTGIALILLGLLQPESVKLGYIELNKLRRDISDANKKADEAIQTATEATAILTWNSARWEPGVGEKNEKLSTDIFRELYGKDADAYIIKLQKEKVLFATPDKLSGLKDQDLSPQFHSPLHEKLMKINSENK